MRKRLSYYFKKLKNFNYFSQVLPVETDKILTDKLEKKMSGLIQENLSKGTINISKNPTLFFTDLNFNNRTFFLNKEYAFEGQHRNKWYQEKDYQKRFHCDEKETHKDSNEKENKKQDKEQYDWSKKADEWSKTFKNWGWKAGWTLFSGLTGYAVANVWPNTYKEYKAKKFRQTIGTDILEIEAQHIEPSLRDYSQYIERPETIFKIDQQFDDIEKQEKTSPDKANIFNNLFLKFDVQLKTKGVKVLLITGVQGSGKSELAEEYTNKYTVRLAKASPSILRTVKLFKVENKEDLEQQYIDFARELKIDVQNYGNIEKVIEKVNDELSLRHYWLLVFDNMSNYEDVKKFIPEGNQYKGRVILTAQDRKVIPKNEFLKIKVIDISQPAYQFTTKESVNLIDNILRESSLKSALSSEKKLELAKSLGYLPLAIKKAALYIRNSKDFPETALYLDSIQKELKGQLKDEKIEIHKDYKIVNDIVNGISIEKINKNTTAIKILSFAAFLNPDYIQRDLLELKFIKTDNIEKDEFLKALDLLKSYGLLEDKGQNCFKLHRSIILAVFDKIPRLQWKVENPSKINDVESIEYLEYIKNYKIKIFDELLKLVNKNFTRDNTVIKEKQENGLFASHINHILDAYQGLKVGKQGSFLTSEFISFEIRLATYYMMTGRSVLGREILKNIKKKVEKDYKINEKLENLHSNQITINILSSQSAHYEKDPSLSAKTIIRKNKGDIISLQENNKNYTEEIQKVETDVLTVYAQIFYHWGCAFYDIGDIENSGIAKKNLEKALIIREIIDSKISNNPEEKKKDKIFNDFDDTKIMNRQGILKFRYKNTVSTQELLNIGKVYRHMIEEEKNVLKPDKKHIQSCKSELFRIIQKLGAAEIDNRAKEEYYKEAQALIKDMYFEDVKPAFNTTEKEKINYNILINGLMKTPRLQNDTRLARYLNDLGGFLLNYEDSLELIEQCFMEAILLIQEKENVNIDLPNSYLGLASYYERKQNLDLAEKALQQCLFIQNKLGVAKTHNDVILAQKMLGHIQEKQTEKDDARIYEMVKIS